MRISTHHDSLRVLLLGFSAIILGGCQDNQDNSVLVEEDVPTLSSFAFLKENNPQLESDVFMTLDEDNTIRGYAIGEKISDASSLIPTFYGEFESVWVGGAFQLSGITSNDYRNSVEYVLRGKGGKESRYKVILVAENGIPRIDVYTKDNQPILTKTEYVDASISISNSPEYGNLESECDIRGRGNATWKNFPKKPYKIKLRKKASLFGFPADKHWVLLSEYSDKSLLRTAYQYEVSTILGMDFTSHYKHVEFYLNGDYQGVYLLAEQVRASSNRIKIDDDGYLFEKDYYYQEEPLSFTTEAFGYHFTFKYPDADKGDIVDSDSDYRFILDYMNAFESSLHKIAEGNQEYLNYIDVHSFAKWYIGQELLGNYDPNRFFVLPSKNSKLVMAPMWDAEWSLGLATLDNGWKQRPYIPNAQSEIWNKREYFSYLMKDPYFKDVVKEEWNGVRPQVLAIKKNIEGVAGAIKYAQKANFERWAILDKYISVGLIALGSWEDEVNYVKTFFDDRVTWFDNYVNNSFKNE